jgi:AraC-like DNA-binding protein
VRWSSAPASTKQSRTPADQVESFEQTGGAPSSGSIVAYIGDEAAEYVASYQPGSHIQATSITISPDYYRDALSARFGDIPDVCHAFEIVSNRRDFPELVMLLRQIRAYRGNGISADLFYEGAVAEAIALIIARAAEIEILGSESNVAHISAEDRRVIEMLPAYIEQHLSEKLPTAALAHKSCMGLTKFKQCFHAVYGTSPGDYVAGKRIDRALDLLESTSHTVAQVGAAVGYSKPSAFNDAFRRRLDCTPNEFRRRKGESSVRHA